jgi:hypothetical protein
MRIVRALPLTNDLRVAAGQRFEALDGETHRGHAGIGPAIAAGRPAEARTDARRGDRRRRGHLIVDACVCFRPIL